jgi:hypothetical protein
MTDIRCAAEIATLRAGVAIVRRLNIALVQIGRNALPPDLFRGANAEVDIIGDGLRIEAKFQQNRIRLSQRRRAVLKAKRQTSSTIC